MNAVADSRPVPVTFELRLPGWVSTALAARSVVCPTLDDRMGLVVDLARQHVVDDTGGPFAAAVFDRIHGRLIAVGVNLVVPSSACIAHAEIVAFAMAGQALQSFDLSAGGPVELVTSTEPCAMCLGAVGWSGVSRLVCRARDADARAVGFDEGDKPDDWAASLEQRGIEVVADVRRADAAAVMALYVERGGLVYNGSTDAEAPPGPIDVAGHSPEAR